VLPIESITVSHLLFKIIVTAPGTSSFVGSYLQARYQIPFNRAKARTFGFALPHNRSATNESSHPPDQACRRAGGGAGPRRGTVQRGAAGADFVERRNESCGPSVEPSRYRSDRCDEDDLRRVLTLDSVTGFGICCRRRWPPARRRRPAARRRPPRARRSRRRVYSAPRFYFRLQRLSVRPLPASHEKSDGRGSPGFAMHTRTSSPT